MFTPTNAFIFAPMFNQPPDGANPNGNDATGAFQPGAQMFSAFCTRNGATVTTVLFNNHASGEQRRNEILHNLAIAPAQIDTIAYFGHGTGDWLASAAIGSSALSDFIASLRGNCGFTPTIVLYACSCGAPNGIASKIADGLSDVLGKVYGHATAGHAFRNPTVRAFPGGTRVAPADNIRGWVEAFNDPKNDLWIRFPFMTDDEIAAELS
jgi:hypothetical protein